MATRKGLNKVSNQGQGDPEKTMKVTQTGGTGVTPRKGKQGSLASGVTKNEMYQKKYVKTTGGAGKGKGET